MAGKLEVLANSPICSTSRFYPADLDSGSPCARLFTNFCEEREVFEAFCKDKLGPLILRLAVGILCVYHGYVKIMYAGGTAWHPGWPVGWQVALSWAEFTAGVAIILGFRCRIAAALVLFVIAIDLAWDEGWRLMQLQQRIPERIVLLLLTGLALVCFGAGELSLDGRTASKAVRKH
jgi:uncharacterized membrane protein YphA (DoxX/SURF4 family)